MAIDLRYQDPLELLDLPLDKLTECVRSEEEWTERHAEVLDQAYEGRVAEALTSRDCLEDIDALHRHISIAKGLLRRHPL